MQQNQRPALLAFGLASILSFLLCPQARSQTRPASLVDCGFSSTSSLAERIQQCRSLNGGLASRHLNQFPWKLVMKTSQIEVWMDETPLVPNGLRGLWVVPQPTAVNFSQAAAFCERATSLVNLRLLRPGVRGQGQQAYFAIPSVDEFYIADRRGMMTHGLRQAMLDSGGFLLRLNNPFWTIDVPSSRDLFRLTLLAGPLSLMIDTVYGGLSQYVYRFHDQLGASLPDDRDHLNYSTCAAWVDSRFF